MHIDTVQEALLDAWACEELITAEATDKLAYRKISGINFQFRKVDYRQRTALLIEVMAVAKGLTDIFSKVQELIADSEDGESVDARIAAQVLPEVIGALATPELHALIDKLCATVNVDKGSGAFETLSNDLVAETVFGPDITLQIPVAITAATFNLGTALSAVKGLL